MTPAWRLAVAEAKLEAIETLAEAAMGNDELRNPGFVDILNVIRTPAAQQKHIQVSLYDLLKTDPKPGEDH